ncbi:MAG: hypothetical protein GY948_03215 [Alphaproteobacteria bacterium]|nr:hypothetical protein [Alphaproteobacteria bacterium]
MATPALLSCKLCNAVIVNHPRDSDNGTTYIHPEYVVLSGSHAGLKQVSETGTFPPLHSVNDEPDGFYDPRNGNIESARSGKLTVWTIIGFIGIGFLMVIFGVLIARGVITS